MQSTQQVISSALGKQSRCGENIGLSYMVIEESQLKFCLVHKADDPLKDFWEKLEYETIGHCLILANGWHHWHHGCL